MKYLRKHIKVISAFLGVNFLSSLVAPYAAYALTSGPTAPEYTSFEPVDTTDMVNLATGDFVYNMPLLEVPGPAGGYPLSLSYHAGIMPNEEASWVGLGWTLNPGAITRTVNGYPDDQYEAKRTRHDRVDGGERNTFSLGVGVPGASFGLSVSNDTYQGFGMGSSFSLGPNFGSNDGGLGIGINATVGHDGYGNTYSGIGAGLTIGKAGADAKGLAASIGVSTNFNSVSLNGGISYRENGNSATGNRGFNQSMVGGSISSKGLKPSATIAGISLSQHNSKANNWTTNSFGFSVPVPLPGPLWLTLGYRYMRYYIDETSDVNVIGALHTDKINKTRDEFDEWGYDAYSLPELEIPFDEQDTEKDIGGSFPAYDHYSVNAQGLSGTMRPYTLGPISLRKQNLKSVADDRNYEILYFNSFNGQTALSHFKFDNDFSNKIVYDVERDPTDHDDLTYDIESGNVGYQKAYSKHIEHFNIAEIFNGHAKEKGLIGETNLHYDYGSDKSNQVGAYKITNESGITFHYTQPVYTYDEYSRSHKKDNKNGVFTEYTQKQPYAYTWLLTAITGSDFVDRNTDGMPNEGDWGYWVDFNYGLWTSNYQWRNPVEEYHSDINSEVENYSSGRKEIWYLNKISTATHTAIFEKELRADGKDVIDLENGGFGALKNQDNCSFNYSGTPSCAHYHHHRVASLLKLKSIYLLNNHDLKHLELEINGQYPYLLDDYEGFYLNYLQSGYTSVFHDNQNVLEINDLELPVDNDQTVRDYLTQKAIRKLDFNHSYDLQDGPGNAGVPNSFDPLGLIYDGSSNIPNDLIDNKYGKLTLDGIQFLGKGGAKVVPPMTFNYGKNPAWEKDHFDIWGFYKSDFDADLCEVNENLARMVTPMSAQNVDAWSLSGIKTSLGSSIEIEYESDAYQTPELYKNFVIPVSNYNYTTSKIELSPSYGDLNDYFSVGDEIIFLYQWEYEYNSLPGQINPIFAHNNSLQRTEVESIISNSSENYIKIAKIPPPSGRKLSNTERGCDPGFIDGKTYILEMHDCNSCVFVSEDGEDFVFKDDIGGVNGEFARENWDEERLAMGTISLLKKVDNSILGGGLRVMRIRVNSNSYTKSSLYNYSFDGVNSGVSSFEPYGLDVESQLVDESNYEGETGGFDIRRMFKKYQNRNFSNLLHISREVQAPGVVYEFVTVTDEMDGNQLPGKQVYNFQVFEEGMVERRAYNKGDWPMTLRNYTARVGNIKVVKTYGMDDKLLLEQKTNYLHQTGLVAGDGKVDWTTTNSNFRNSIESKFNDQGIFMEFYHEDKQVELPDPSRSHGVRYERRESYSLREYYPSIIIGTETKNYKTGIRSITNNLAFDFFSGDVTASYSDDGYGNKYVSKSVPAYHYYPEMGFGINGGRNMLTQEGTTYSYRMDDSFVPEDFLYGDDVASNATGLMGASAQSWSKGIGVIDGNTVIGNQSVDNIYRKHAGYSYTGLPASTINQDGTLAASEFEELALLPITVSEATGWQKNSEITLYDINSHALEATDVNGNFAATRFDSKNERVIATAANARYGEFTYSGFESTADGGFTITGNGSGPTTQKSHTGKHSVKLLGTAPVGRALVEIEPEKNKTYRISYWTNQPSAPAKLFYKKNGGSDVTIAVPGSTERSVTIDGTLWKLKTVDFTTPSSFSSLAIGLKYNGGTVYIDDFRLMPLDATMTSYVYNEWGELSDILDANNLYTHYEYDSMGRLKSVTRETLDHGPVLTSEVDIHYGDGEAATNLAGNILANYLGSGALRLNFNFISPGSGDYTYDWKVDGQTVGTGSFANYSFSSGGTANIAVSITDNETGLAISKFKRQNLELCEPNGTVLSSVCERDSDGCYTGWITKTIARGDCTSFTRRDYEPMTCQDQGNQTQMTLPDGDGGPIDPDPIDNGCNSNNKQ